MTSIHRHLGCMVQQEDCTVFEILNHELNTVDVSWLLDERLTFLIGKREVSLIQFLFLNSSSLKTRWQIWLWLLSLRVCLFLSLIIVFLLLILFTGICILNLLGKVYLPLCIIIPFLTAAKISHFFG